MKPADPVVCRYARATADGAFPEARLYPMLIGSIILPISLFIYAFTVSRLQDLPFRSFLTRRATHRVDTPG